MIIPDSEGRHEAYCAIGKHELVEYALVADEKRTALFPKMEEIKIGNGGESTPVKYNYTVRMRCQWCKLNGVFDQDGKQLVNYM